MSIGFDGSSWSFSLEGRRLWRRAVTKVLGDEKHVSLLARGVQLISLEVSTWDGRVRERIDFTSGNKLRRSWNDLSFCEVTPCDVLEIDDICIEERALQSEDVNKC